jgi:peptidoglycan/xylan/chitin deacetylase (PgdA/CDA1 family)
MQTLRSNCFRLLSCAWPEKVTERREERDGFVDIIMTHGVHDSGMLRYGLPPLSSASLESFRANLESLARTREVISITAAIAVLEEGRRPERRYGVLTFDDSLACTSRVAIPEVLRVGIPATVFVSTEILDTGEPYWWLRLDHAWRQAKAEHACFSGPEGETVVIRRDDPTSLCRAKGLLRAMQAIQRDREVGRLEQAFGACLSNPVAGYPYAEAMTWAEVRELTAKGIDIGSHTVTHSNLELLSSDEVAWELGESKRRLELELGIACASFCYPYGKFAPWVPALVREAGYRCAATTVSPGRNLPRQDPYLLKRFPMTSEPYKLGYELSGFPRLIRRRGERG